MLLKKYIKILLKLNVKLKFSRVYLVNKINQEIINKIFNDFSK